MARYILLILLIVFSRTPVSGQEGIDNTDVLLAAQYFRNGEFDKAVVLYEKLFLQSPGHLVYTHYLECLFNLNDFRKAERVVRSQIRQFPGDISYQVDLGWVFGRSGNTRQQSRHFENLIRSLEDQTGMITALADAFQRRGYDDYAIETFLHARRFPNRQRAFYSSLANLFERTGQFSLMMNEYLSYIEAFPDETGRIMGVLQDAIANDPGFARNEALRESLLSRVQLDPGNVLYSEMLLWLSIQQQDFRLAFMQARALDLRLREDGFRVLEVGKMASANRQYNHAALAFKYVVDKGNNSPYYMDGLTGYLDVRFQEVISGYQTKSDELLEVEQAYRRALDELGVNASTVVLVRNLARLHAFYLGNRDTAAQLLNQTLAIPQVGSRVQAECRVELADILLLHGDVWEAALLYAQVDKMFRDDPLGHEARFKSARLSFYIGEFDWAKAQLDVLKSATSRLIANDAMQLSLRIQDNIGFDGETDPLRRFARAEMLIFMNRFEEALLALDSIVRLFPVHAIIDDVLFAKAGLYMRKGKYALADTLLDMIATNYPDGLLADEALMARAGLYENVFKDAATAMSLYQQLLIRYPGSLHSVQARNRFRYLRGDRVNPA